MIGKSIDSITLEDVEALLANGVREARTIEYKLKLPDGSDSGKKELLKDVSSFANAGGGDLIFGIREEDGLPVEIVGLPGFQEDEQKLRIEPLIRDGIEPRIPGIRLHAVDAGKKGAILLVRIPKSWSAPHMVRFKGSSRFFTRSSAGVYQLDVTEIRSAFASSGELAERIKRWRDERLSRIIARESPVPLVDGSVLVLHLVPLDSFVNDNRLDVAELIKCGASFPPLGPSGGDPRINVDGLLNFRPYGDGRESNAYCQVFRSGRVEAVRAGIVSEGGGERRISCNQCESSVVATLRILLPGLQKVDVSMPLVVCISAMGVKGACMSANRFAEPIAIDRDVLLLPDVLLDSYECEVASELRPAFDALWNAAGFPRSRSYDEAGGWDPDR